MNATELFTMCEGLFEYYRLTSTPTPEQYELWLEDLAYIPGSACRDLAKAIRDEFDNLPRNLPKAIRAAYTNMPKSASNMVFDPVEDLRFPVMYLQAGYKVLSEQGLAAFKNYADMVHMPVKDRDRVTFKHDLATGKKRIDFKAIKRNIARAADYATRLIEENRVAYQNGEPASKHNVRALVAQLPKERWVFEAGSAPATARAVDPQRMLGMVLPPPEAPHLARERERNIRQAQIHSDTMREPGEEG